MVQIITNSDRITNDTVYTRYRWRILDIAWLDFVRNVDVREAFSQPAVTAVVQQRRPRLDSVIPPPPDWQDPKVDLWLHYIINDT